MAGYSDSVDVLNASEQVLILPENLDEVKLTDVASFRLDTALIEQMAPKQAIDTVSATTNEVKVDWKNGLEGSAIQNAYTDNSGILTLIVILFVIVSLNFKECRKLFTHFVDELLSNKKRENAFDEHSNHETRLTILTIIQYIVYGGIILFGIASYRVNGELNGKAYDFVSLMSIIGLFTGYYFFQITAYHITGYTFTDKDGYKRWIRAFNASQSLAGAFMMFPALMILFYPDAIESMFFIACVIYVLARLIFIVKGFSIFYNNIFSPVYFILYLCALEIIPVIYIYKLAILIV